MFALWPLISRYRSTSLKHSAAPAKGSHISPGRPLATSNVLKPLTCLHRCQTLVGKGGHVLIGVDMDKDPDLLHQAYNDSSGVTADFNRNILVRINNEFGGQFDVGGFDHSAIYDPDASRIVMRLVSRTSQIAWVSDQRFAFDEGETIITEYSHKYTLASFRSIASEAGLESVKAWTDRANLFSIHLLQSR